jgi:hypothetical protein
VLNRSIHRQPALLSCLCKISFCLVSACFSFSYLSSYLCLLPRGVGECFSSPSPFLPRTVVFFALLFFTFVWLLPRCLCRMRCVGWVKKNMLSVAFFSSSKSSYLCLSLLPPPTLNPQPSFTSQMKLYSLKIYTFTSTFQYSQ